MPTKSVALCGLQLARERRLSVYPEDIGIEQDICDVTLWLIEKYRLPRVLVWVARHYTQVSREIASVTIVTWPRQRKSLNEVAHEAFLALGYLIEDTGADTYGHKVCEGRHSKHEAIHAFARIEEALIHWRST